MLKRTKGRLLLTLLVTTGLAGTINNSTLSQKERKHAILLIKDSRAELIASTKGLSGTQVNYVPADGRPSIAEVLSVIVSDEQAAGAELKKAMALPSEPENRYRINVSDEELLDHDNLGSVQKGAAQGSLSRHDELMKKFFVLRTNHIKYLRTSTEDFRNHMVQTPAGWLDCYQYYLRIADRTFEAAQLIKEIRTLPGFPKR